jgi:hypothetical protein
MRINVRNNKLKSFTLIETIATILIYAMMMLMITNIVLVNARLSQQLKIRSRIRSEMSQVVAMIKRDVRNAATVDAEHCTDTSCSLTIVNNLITWSYSATNHTITRKDGLTNEIFTTADYLSVDYFNFYTISDAATTTKQVTIILTIKAKGTNEAWKVNNQIAQEIISSRNYGLSN